MNMKQVREMAKRVGAKIGNMKKLDAIRAIQLAEGNSDCYGRPENGQCGQIDCCFREDCLAPAAAGK
ncbi:MAG: SAP domain-containing protein [Thermodesulfobacteriota bacterium]